MRYKHGVQCRTPSRSDRFNGVTGVARGPKGRNRNLPRPPGKKVIKMLICCLPYSLRKFALQRISSSLLEGAFWCGTNSNIKPALKGDSSRARPVGDAARGESGGIGSIASGSAARRPYSNQRCGFRVAKAGGVIKRLIALCLSQPLSLTSFDSSPAGEPFGIVQAPYSPARGSSSLGPLPR